MTHQTLAAQLYTLRDHTQTEDDFLQTLKKVRQIGYTSVQISAIGPIPPEKVKACLDKSGLQCCITHTAFDRLIDDLPAVIREHQLWNCQHVGLGHMPPQFIDQGEAGYLEFAKIANSVGQKLADAGLTFSYHNHSFEFQKFNGRTGMDIIFEETDPRYCHAILDTYWVQHGGGDPAVWIHKMDDRQSVVHYKDMVIFERAHQFAEVGEGNMNWETINQAVRECDVPFIAVEQDICQRDPFESLQISYNNLVGWGFA
ncbi:MAG: sugar phosphate isomerase/epimerase family protein [Anaerolineae bacterium]